MRLLFHALLTSILVLTGTSAYSANLPPDPLQSSQWETMALLYLKDGKAVVFNDQVKVIAPPAAEDSLSVPVMVDASAIDKVEKIVVFADFNPLPKVLEFFPKTAQAKLGFRFKIQQASPIRAAVLDQEGVWHVGGVWVDAAGGGCTLPSVGSGDAQWSSRLGEVSARLWARSSNQRRLRFSVVHPMDTGLADGIPKFHIETMQIKDITGRELATLHPYEPIAENPVFSLDLPGSGSILLNGRDNNGNDFWAEINP